MIGPMIRRFGRYPAEGGIPTAEASRADGYAAGLMWADDYQPGGPCVITAYKHELPDDDWAAYCAATAENRREWLAGFAAARARVKAAP